MFRFSPRANPIVRRVLLFGPATTSAPLIDPLMKYASFNDAFSEVSRIAENFGWCHDNRPEARQATGADAFERYLVGEVVLQLSAIRALTSHGYTFDTVAGISVGEFAAAHVAGVLTLEESIELVSAMAREVVCARGGDLVGVNAPENRARAAIAGIDAITIVDWPERSVWAVPHSSLPRIEHSLRREKIAFATMGVECMPHTPMVNARRFADTVRHIPARGPVMPLYSSVTGGRVDGEIGTDFWARMCSSPAMFRSMHDVMQADGHRDFVHIGSVAVERVMFASLPQRERPRMISAASILAGARGKST